MQEFFQGLEFSSFIWQIVTPLVFSLCDIISGYIQAVINHNVDSSKMRAGLWHKVLIAMILLLSVIMSFAFNITYIVSTVAIYIIIMEITSILENIKKAGVDIKMLDFIKEKKE